MIAIVLLAQSNEFLMCLFPRSPLSFDDNHSVRAPIAGNLGNHFLHDGAAERLKILRHNDEGPRTTNDVVAIVFLQPAGRIDVLVFPMKGTWGR
jgi:hypothetical protein